MVADCHFHVIDLDRFPLPPGPGYKPTREDRGALADFLGHTRPNEVTHGLVVQLSGYGFDNRGILDAVASTKGRLKAIAVVEPSSSLQALQGLGELGVVGVRFNLPSFQADGLAQAEASGLLARLAELGWFADVHCRGPEFPHVAPILRRAKVNVLIDHMGSPDLHLGADEPGFRAMLDLAQTGRAAVKLSGAFRASLEGPPHSDLDPFVEAILEAYTLENCVWGSDWPFVKLARRPTYPETLATLTRWLPEPRDRQNVLWKVPARLFGFKPFDGEGPE